MKALAQKARVLLQFFIVQGVALIGNVLYGLLCVRLLPESEYVKFVVVFGVCGTLVVLTDVNFSTSLIPLVGERVNDRKLIADYLASLRQISHYIYGVVAVGTIFCYPMLVKNRGWNWHIVLAMIATLLFATWFIRVGAAYGTVLLLIRERALWYRGQVIQSLGTLVLLAVFLAFHRLNGFIAILINVSGIVFVGIFYYHYARNRLGERGHSSEEKRRSIFRLALPNAPQAIFYALQGQLSLLLITYFGHPVSVASVGALARLGGIFTLFAQMNSILVEPYFAKLPKPRLLKSYAAAVSVAAIACIAITLVAWLTPEVFLWVLGPQYSGLHREVLLVIATGGISTLTSLLWCIHSSRRFVYWWNVGFSISFTVVVQIACVAHFNMGTARGVLVLNLFTNLASLVVNVSSGLYGFLYGARETETQPLTNLEKALTAEILEAPGVVTADPLQQDPGTDGIVSRHTEPAVLPEMKR